MPDSDAVQPDGPAHLDDPSHLDDPAHLDELAEPDAPDEEGEGKTRDVAEVGVEAARGAWAEAARESLVAAARRYRAVVTYKELAAQVQDETGIRTTQLMHHWIGDVLSRVTAQCAEQGEPLLAALCVNAEGSVGEGYAVAVAAATGDRPGDGDDHAARERLACYRHWEAAGLPADGGRPELTMRLSAARTRARKRAAAEATVRLCPTCHMAVPATGVCDGCD